MSEREKFHEDLFTETAEGVFLIARKCDKCGNIQFPQKGFCQKCLDNNMKDILIGNKGKLFSYTTTYGKAAQLEGPFDVGYVMLPEGIRVFAPVRKKEDEDYEIGMDMELETADLWEEAGVIKTAYRYRTVNAGEAGV